MADRLSHEDISRKFIDSGALDFAAAGKFIAENGPELAILDDGLHGVFAGRFSLLACVLPADDLQHLIGGLRGLSGLREAVNVKQQG